MATQRKWHNASNTTTNAAGQFSCPKCGGEVRPMSGGKGWICAQRRKVGTQWTGCDGMIFARALQFGRKKVDRAADWPTIARPTPEQVALMEWHATAPAKRGGRLATSNAGPGCAKSSSMAWTARAVAQRVGDVSRWYLAAFNAHSRDDLLGMLPASWPNVFTLNGLFGNLQGYNFKSYDDKKARGIFKELTEHLKGDDKPHAGPLFAVLERMRDMLLYTDDEGNRPFWSEAIGAVAMRFPSLAKRLAKENAAEVVRDYLPAVAVRLMANNKKIDLTEQYARPALDALRRSGWKMPTRLVECAADWEDEDIRHLAALIRSINLPQVDGLIVDEAQDLSLSQICAVLACTWKRGELTLVGDDYAADPYKAGQGIYAWRGAFRTATDGLFVFVRRLWHELTGEGCRELPLSVTHRFGPELVRFVQPLNTVLKSSKPEGTSEVYQCSEQQAFDRWLAIADNERALWITRRNAPLAPVFLETIKARKRCCLRGNGEMTGQVDTLLYECAGWYDDKGEYKTSLRAAIAKLQAIIAENAPEPGQPATDAATGDDIPGFVLAVMEAVQADPSILAEAEITDQRATVGNVRRFITYYATTDANRVLSTVYRCKGDQADLVVVADLEAFNTAWNGDEKEAAACRHVAATRAKKTLCVTGVLAGCDMATAKPMTDAAAVAPETLKAAPVAPVAPAVVKAAPVAPRPAAVVPMPVSLTGERPAKATKAPPVVRPFDLSAPVKVEPAAVKADPPPAVPTPKRPAPGAKRRQTLQAMPTLFDDQF
jgi:hypothetical protein